MAVKNAAKRSHAQRARAHEDLEGIRRTPIFDTKHLGYLYPHHSEVGGELTRHLKEPFRSQVRFEGAQR